MVVLLSGLIGAGVGLAWWLLSPAPRTYHRHQHQADLPCFFHTPLAIMRAGAIVHAQHEGSPRQIQFRKTNHHGAGPKLRLEIPDSPQTRAEEALIRERLTAAGFHCTRPKAIDPRWPAQGNLLMAVSELTPIDAFRAAEVTRVAMGLTQDDRFTIHIEGIASVKVYREYLAAK